MSALTGPNLFRIIFIFGKIKVAWPACRKLTELYTCLLDKILQAPSPEIRSADNAGPSFAPMTQVNRPVKADIESPKADWPRFPPATMETRSPVSPL